MSTSQSPDAPTGTAVAVVQHARDVQPHFDPLLDAVSMLAQVAQLAQTMLASGFMPRGINTEAKAIAVMLTGREMGLGPMQSIRSINVIDAKPVVAADLQLALFKKSGGRSRFEQLDDMGAVLWLQHPNGDEHIESFTMKDAQAAQLLNKDNWKKHPRAMLRSRVITAALKSIGFESTTGIYDPEEIEHLAEPQQEERQQGNARMAAQHTPPTPTTHPTTPSTTARGTTPSERVYVIDGGGEVSRYKSRMPSSDKALRGAPFDALSDTGSFLFDDGLLDKTGAFSAQKMTTETDAASVARWTQIAKDIAAELDRRVLAADEARLAPSPDAAAAASPSTGA